ncbi:MAG: hypothetical protein IJX53_08115 [Clostridia bacterium]|nr:hypothetical protein [Clostridia bacterium]
MFFYLTSEEPGLLSELWDYFVNKYFSIEYGVYDNIDVGSSAFFSPASIIICMFIGIVLASVLAIFNKRVLGDFVRAISRESATSPEKAMTLEQLGFLKNSAVRSALKRNGSLRRAVRCVEDDRADLEAGIPLRPGIAELYGDVPLVEGAPGAGRTDLNAAHFYIPQAEIYTAEIRYEKKGTNWLSLLGVIVLCLILVSLLFKLMPDIFQLLDNFINMVKPEGKILM